MKAATSTVRKVIEARLAIVVFVLSVAALLILAASQRRLDHDEHQFIASAFLLARQGLLPYLDYAYFHLPYLIAPYALLFLVTDHLLLSARLFSVACSLIMLALIAGYAARTFKHAEQSLKVTIASGSVALLVVNPLFSYTFGRAWNHDASIMLTVAATLVFLRATQDPSRTRLLAMAGALLGLAIGTRLTLLPLLVPFIAGPFFLQTQEWSLRAQLRAFAWLGLGVALALLPLFLLLVSAPGDFLFGNLGYPRLNTLYREVTGYPRAMSVVGKGLYFLERVFIDPGNLLLFALLGFAVFRVGVQSLRRSVGRELAFLLTLIGFALLGALAPTPSFPQYFYALIPLTLLATTRALGLLSQRPSHPRAVFRFFLVVLAVCALRGLPEYWFILQKKSPGAPSATETHALALQIHDAVPHGKVLTLAPTFPLEGGLEIYRPFVTGPFAWRTAPLLPGADRRRHRVIAPADLDEFLRGQQAAAILLGVEAEDLEQPLLDYARMNDYRAMPLNTAITLWVPPGGR